VLLVDVTIRDPRTGEGVCKTLDVRIVAKPPLLVGNEVEAIAEAVRAAVPELVLRLSEKKGNIS
jgi:hypothetical protein